MGFKYNPNNDNIFDVTNEKTDYRTDLKTDHRTDNVTWHSRRVCTGPWWRRRCWNENYSVPNTTLNNRNRKLNEEENLEQVRLSLLEEIRAYFQGDKPRDQKFVDAKATLSEITKLMHEIGAEKNRHISLIGMLSPKTRENLVKRILFDTLPSNQRKLINDGNNVLK